MTIRPIGNQAILAFFVFVGACTGGGSGSTNLEGGDATGIAVVSSDYVSSSISLVHAADGTLARDACIDSGAVTPILSVPLSGCVILPSRPQARHELLIIDRTNSALLFLDPQRCEVLRQLSVGTGFYANPHDVVSISEKKAYVTRFERNPIPSGVAGANDEGSDLLIIDPSAPAILGRIDMGPYATTVPGATIEPRPDHALLAEGKVYVALDNQDQDFRAIGPGRIVVVDPVTDGVSGMIDIPDPFRGCTGLDYVASSKTLLVACSGDYNDPARQISQSALLAYDLGGQTPILSRTILTSAAGGRAIAESAFTSVGDHNVISVSFGEFSGAAPDTVWNLDLRNGAGRKVADGDGTFVLGGPLADTTNHRLYIPDATTSAPRVNVYQLEAMGDLTATGSFHANPKSGLPPIQVGWY
jgi:hypothetical protein